jgi:hypothetical protein
MGGNVQRLVQLTITQDPQAAGRDLAEQAFFNDFLRSNLRTLIQPGKITDVEGRVSFLKDGIGETALWHPAMQWHLAALETALLAAPGSGPHTFVSAACRFAVARSRTAANALHFMSRSWIRSQCIDA